MTPNGKKQLEQDEGRRVRVYDDRTSATVLRLPSGGYPTIGIGRNLATRGLSGEEIDLLFSNDIATEEDTLSRHVKSWELLPPVWRDVLVMIAFNTGDAMRFPEMLAAMAADNADEAAAQLMNSKAARELPERYGRMKDAILRQVWA